MRAAWPCVLAVAAGAELAALGWLQGQAVRAPDTSATHLAKPRPTETPRPAFRRTLRPPRYAVVTPPPPAPNIDRFAPSRRDASGGDLVGLNRLDPSSSASADRRGFRIAVSDRDAQPTHRVEPIAPAGWSRPGQCHMRFDVDVAGRPDSIVIIRSSDPQLDHACRQAVGQWVFDPKVDDGLFVRRTGVESTLGFAPGQ